MSGGACVPLFVCLARPDCVSGQRLREPQVTAVTAPFEGRSREGRCSSSPALIVDEVAPGGPTTGRGPAGPTTGPTPTGWPTGPTAPGRVVNGPDGPFSHRVRRRPQGAGTGRKSSAPARIEEMSPPEEVLAYGEQVAAVLNSVLADDFVAAYFVGSIALGGYVPGESDIDIVAAGRRPLTEEMKPAVVEQLLDTTTNCPARGLEFTLYRADVASSPPVHADFEVNVNGGPHMPRCVHCVRATNGRSVRARSSDRPPMWNRDRGSASCHGIRRRFETGAVRCHERLAAVASQA